MAITSKQTPSLPAPDITGATVAVLTDSHTFHVHAAVLTSTSKLFQKVFKPEWQIDLTKPIDVHDANSAAFALYTQWLYVHQLLTHTSPTLAALYVLGERLMDDIFTKCVTRALLDKFKDIPPTADVLRTMYAGTTPTSPGRRLVRDACAYWMKLGEGFLQELRDDEDGEMMVDLVKALVGLRALPVRAQWVADATKYGIEEAEKKDAGEVMSLADLNELLKTTFASQGARQQAG